VWIELTTTSGSKVVVSLNNVEYVVDNGSSGSRLVFRSEQAEGLTRAISVQEPFDKVAHIMGTAGAAIARDTGTKNRTGAAS